LSSFDTAKVTDMGEMFSYCVSLTALDLSSFNTAKVTRKSRMFDGCESLRPVEF
ncbi:MAG: BspA family leucine-rich repeat surface protein, partial [Prevotellaceae bacterium]|nr:BspA family leucine-rich repeat surface protein [Prevotellaceae bacterium]